MKILAIDFTYGSFGGSRAQIIQIIKNLDAYDFDKCIIYSNKDNSKLFDLSNENISIVKVKVVSSSLFFRILWQQLVLPFRLVLDKASILFSPGNISPIICFTKKTQWIHTIGPFEGGFYKYFSVKEKIKLYLNKLLMKYSSLTSDHVFFMSNYTFDLFVNNHDFNRAKGSVIHMNSGEEFFPIDEFYESNILPFIDKKFILTVSHLYPYKNIELLLEAFSIYSQNEKAPLLLIAGSNTYSKVYYDSLIALSDSLNLSDNVFFIGNMSGPELRELYNLCQLFVFTSPFENYPFTLIEAMSCGAPIIATNTSSMPETCGEAVSYYDPSSINGLVDKISQLMSDDLLRLKYKKLSIEHAFKIDTAREINKKTNIVLTGIVSN